MSEIPLKIWRVEFEDGTVKRVHGRYGAHAWANAQTMNPARTINGLTLLGEYKPEQAISAQDEPGPGPHGTTERLPRRTAS